MGASAPSKRPLERPACHLEDPCGLILDYLTDQGMQPDPASEVDLEAEFLLKQPYVAT